MKNRSFPGWVGPFVGPIVGAAVAWRALGRDGQAANWTRILLAAGLGLVAGVIVWLLDLVKRRNRKDEKDAAPGEG